MKKIAYAFAALLLGLTVIGCNRDDKTPNPNGKANLFDEINEKIEVAQKSLGSLTSSVEPRSAIHRNAPNQGQTDVTPFYIYDSNDIPSFVNKQQQMLYIISIVNYVREHLMDNSYGVEFKYDTLYEGNGFMETLKALNQPIRQYGGPTPVLQLRYSHGENWLGFESNWDYQSDFMEANMAFWNMRILSKTKIVFDKNQKIKQIWVNYTFEGGLAFACQTCLFDYENEYFYTFFIGNSNGEFVTYSDPSLILQGYNKVNEGTATSGNLFVTNNVEAQKARLTVNSSSDEYVGYRRWCNRVDITDINQFQDWSEFPDTKGKFNALYDEIYNKLSGFTLLTDYSGENAVRIDDLVNDSANYAFWRSCFIYDSETKVTYIPYLEREELIKHFNALKEFVDDDVDTELDFILNSPQASKEKYIGNFFTNGEDNYRIALCEEDAQTLWNDNLITYCCAGGFSYELYKNDVKLIRFAINNGSVNIVQ